MNKKLIFSGIIAVSFIVFTLLFINQSIKIIVGIF